jgi:mannosylglycerate synthase
MSAVCFPFKVEDPAVVLGNIEVAAAHPRVTRVLCVGAEENDTFAAVAPGAEEIAVRLGRPVEVVVQERIGKKRVGKGDGMNTALRWFSTDSDADRLHFYDSDITSFGPEWITSAEEAADLGYGVVRHYFPRASTDAMITWMITRTGFAMLWPRSELPWVEQPLGGELLFRRDVVEHLLADDRVQAQSDWGVDTLYTFSTVQAGIPFYEAYVTGGKAHRLYGRLTDLKTMLVECFAAVQSLRGEEVPEFTPHRIEYPDTVPQSIAEKLGYNIEATIQLLTEKWTDRQEELLGVFSTPVRDAMYANRQRPTFDFMDEASWYETFHVMLDHFVPGDADWEEILFKLWTTRVLHYSVRSAIRGYSYAQRDLHGMVGRYLRRAARERA